VATQFAPILCCEVVNLRGRKAVRADRQLRTDEEAIRTQLTILCKSHPKPHSLLSITVFFGRMSFIRTKNTVGARSAQVLSWRAPLPETSYMYIFDGSPIRPYCASGLR